MTLARGKALLHLKGRLRRVVDADDIYYLEPPVSKVLPVSRRSLNALLAAYRAAPS